MNPGGSSSSSFVGLNNGESGILRKTNALGHHHHHHHYGQDSTADLLVFGYSCKVFRDDEKARFIDQGRHLIPWMGDNQLKIDRYDARGALHDLSQHEPPIGGYGNRLDCLSPAEQRAEQLCEEERYYSLYANEVEEEIYLEEAAKRQSADGAEIPFNYDSSSVATNATVVGPEPSDATVSSVADDENSTDPPFVALANFDIPSDLDLPDTMKEHAIIEKTAKFIASQDSQMEILLRAKQAANPQFDFLGPGGRLYRYYRHVLMAIKTNQYPEDVPAEEESNAADVEQADDSLPESTEKTPEKAKVIVPAIKYKPSVDCAYTQLISKITGAPIPTKALSDEPNQESSLAAPIDASQLTSLNSNYSYCTEEPSIDVKKVSTGLAGLVQYDSDSDDSVCDATEQTGKEEAPKGDVERREITFDGTLPPEIFQHVIEKTAAYVAKNGYSFEEALRSKNDPRFLFLRKDHEFYPYYAFRVRYLIDPFEEVPRSPETVTIVREIENGTVVETPSIGIKTVNTAPVPIPVPPSLIQATKPGGAVCFSIKSKDDANVTLKSNVMQELDGDEEEAEAVFVKKKEEPDPPEPSIDTEPSKDEPKETEAPEVVPTEENTEDAPPQDKNIVEDDVKQSSTPPLEEPMTQQVVDEETKDLKRLEERIKDKLAIAARERLALISKEKQLQLERKKKASAFLSMIGKTEPREEDDPTDKEETTDIISPNMTPPAPAKNGLELLQNQFSDVDEKNGDSDSSEISIHSIPSQSDSPASNRVPSSADDDVVLVEDDTTLPPRSRTRTRSSSGSATLKKRKHKHKSKSKGKSKSKKKKSRSMSRSRSRSRSKTKHKRKRSRSRSRSRSHDLTRSSRRSRSRSRSERDTKKNKKSKKKSHKRLKSSRSSSTTRHHRNNRKEKCSRDGEYY
ncbi:protein suppressor of white apricot isoform X2 [Toxorhynchites rutilus septentrionalis]|uniref:protein suppressor of white apricot isoform X2 n=1 Tax=Toxorhynchites rutilus septentrionalis TaxID=329112 RepID=UPI002479AEF3|nr:protein suppressor of white apricot isoform X2 [Toxorhynchites rutilus septentrionalis]